MKNLATRLAMAEQGKVAKELARAHVRPGMGVFYYPPGVHLPLREVGVVQRVYIAPRTYFGGRRHVRAVVNIVGAYPRTVDTAATHLS